MSATVIAFVAACAPAALAGLAVLIVAVARSALHWFTPTGR